MKYSLVKRLSLVAGFFFLLITAGILFYLMHISNPTVSETDSEEGNTIEKLANENLEKMDRKEKKMARSEYYFKLLRDPKTNSIPPNIRNRELDFAKTLPSIQQVQRRAKAKDPSFKAAEYIWESAGPFDLGGRTRALAVDRRNPDIVLAGAVSGGMWKSTDGGQNWDLRTPDLANLSVTSVAQDPLNPDTWYYASGELIANSASAIGAAYYGEGIYKSTDNGDSWSVLPQASSNIKGLVDTYNTVSRIVVSPVSGSVFISSAGFGIYRSTDGVSFSEEPVLGTEGEQLFCDVAVATDGTIAAVLSEAAFDDQLSADSNSTNHNPGVFISNDDGQTWNEITVDADTSGAEGYVDTFPATHRRSVLTFAPSNPDILYILTLKGIQDQSNQSVSFHKIDLAAQTSDDRSANLPDFRDSNGEGSGYMELQDGYNMEVAVKPDDENYVFVGGINLFRSTDGFSMAPSGSDMSVRDRYWIGGYSKENNFASYPNHHPDQHRVIFPQPQSNPNIMWSAHDGGLSYTTDVTANSVEWINRDNGYVTSQFYSAALPQEPNDPRLMGGTQDNGTPFFLLNDQDSQPTLDITSGDGGYAYFTENEVFVSAQSGQVLRWNEDFTELSYVFPEQASDQLFIHPYVIDPNDENIMYYPEGNHIWRNTSLEQIATGNSSDGATTGWEEFSSINIGSQHTISAIAVSESPSDILYMGGYSAISPPVLRRLENANSVSDGETDIPLPASSNLDGAYIKDIAINPINASEVIIVLSNYSIVGLYHTTDGGENWNAVEGNLTGNEVNPGPSLRSAAIIPAQGGTIYMLATSTGLYSTQILDGNNTEWGQEATSQIGNVVVEDLTARLEDGNVGVGTHGRGFMVGDFQGITRVPSIKVEPTEGAPGDQVTITATNYSFNPTSSNNEVTFGEKSATILEASATQLTVSVPRAVFGPDAENNSIIITASNMNVEASTNFQILTPEAFSLKQNFPNPFRSSTRIPFDITSESDITLEIYNTNGQKVLVPIKEEKFNSGTYNERVRFPNLASGVYIYRLIATSPSGEIQMDSRKMTLIK